MAHPIKVLAIKPDNLNLILETTWWKETSTSCKWSLDLRGKHVHVCMDVLVHTCTNAYI